MNQLETTLFKLVANQRVAYFTTMDETDFPVTRAVYSTRKKEGVHEFYISTNLSSNHVQQLLEDPRSCLYFCDPRFIRGVYFKGIAEVLTDHDSKAMIWEDTDTMYYHEGVDDPDYVVVKVTTQSGRFYRSGKSINFIMQNNELQVIE